MVKIYQVGLERQRWNAVVKQVKKGCENNSAPGSDLVTLGLSFVYLYYQHSTLINTYDRGEF